MSYLEGSMFFGDSTLEDTLVKNTIAFLNQGFLEIGAYRNIAKGQLGYRGNDESKLYPISISGITNYTVYRGIKHNWVWETTGIQLKYNGGTLPYVPTGIYVNNTFYPNGSTITGTGFYIDFSRGQVVFDKPLSTGHTVQCQYAVRAIDIAPEDSDLFIRLNGNWRQNIVPTGTSDISLQNYLPCIFIGLQTYKSKPVELGSRAKWCTATLRLSWFTNNGSEFRKIQDNLYMMEDKTVDFYRIDRTPKSLNYRGELISGALTHAYLAFNHFDGLARFLKVKINKIQNSTLLPLRKGIALIDLETMVNPQIVYSDYDYTVEQGTLPSGMYSPMGLPIYSLPFYMN